jgi:hypothetical protein
MTSIRVHGAVWCSDDVLHSYLEGVRFESLPEQEVMVIEDFRGFPRSLKANVGIILRLNHDHFFPNPFQFIIHQ